MNRGFPAQEYQKNAVNGASPVQLVIMLYDGAIRYLDFACAAIEAKDLDKQNLNCQKAQKIVFELMTSLDMYRGGEIAQQLMGLYAFTVEQIVLGNVEDRTEPLKAAKRVLGNLRESWVEVEKNTRIVAEDVRLAA